MKLTTRQMINGLRYLRHSRGRLETDREWAAKLLHLRRAHARADRQKWLCLPDH